MKLLLFILSLITLSSCWPTSVSFKDSGSMPIEWKAFHMKTLEINAANCPLFYAAQLSEKVKDGIQNNTRLSLATKLSDAEVQIEGQILNYQVNPIAIENGDNASKNRLSLSGGFAKALFSGGFAKALKRQHACRLLAPPDPKGESLGLGKYILAQASKHASKQVPRQ